MTVTVKVLNELRQGLVNKIDPVLLDEYDAYREDLIDNTEFFGEDHNIEGVKFFKGIDVGAQLGYIKSIQMVDELLTIVEGE